MKKLLLILAPFICFNAQGSEKFSCDDLTSLANDLDTIAVAFESAGTIHEGDEVDQALGGILDALQLVTDIEDEPRLDSAVDSLFNAYNQMDGEKFSLALDSVVINIDRLYRRDCD